MIVGASFLVLPKSPTASSANANDQGKESFSELTLFLFASGVALFVALAGWSDQIRGIDKDTRELERTFLAGTGVSKKSFLSVVKAASPDDELTALTAVMAGGTLQNVDSIRLLGIFKNWHKDWKHLESVADVKYTLTVALTFSFFLSGLISLFTSPRQQFVVRGFVVRDELLLLLCPVILMTVILGIVIYSGFKEKALRSLLTKMTDMV